MAVSEAEARVLVPWEVRLATALPLALPEERGLPRWSTRISRPPSEAIMQAEKSTLGASCCKRHSRMKEDTASGRTCAAAPTFDQAGEETSSAGRYCRASLKVSRHGQIIYPRFSLPVSGTCRENPW